jgi:hypothetical protein
MPHSAGYRGRTRTLFKKDYKTKGAPHATVFLRDYKVKDLFPVDYALIAIFYYRLFTFFCFVINFVTNVFGLLSEVIM